MVIKINGQEKTIPNNLTLSNLIEYLKLKSERVAIELNAMIKPRLLWEETLLKDDDILEIVYFVGGGI